VSVFVEESDSLLFSLAAFVVSGACVNGEIRKGLADVVLKLVPIDKKLNSTSIESRRLDTAIFLFSPRLKKQASCFTLLSP